MFTNPARGGQMPKKRLSQKMTPNPDMKKKKKTNCSREEEKATG